MELDEILSQYRMYHYRNDSLLNGMRVNRLFGLNELIKENLKPTDIICEIGSYSGATASIFAYYCKKVYCVDTFDMKYDGHNYEIIFDNIMSKFDNITKIKGYSVDVAKIFQDGYFNFVYIDGDHHYQSVKDDINAWINKVVPGGLIGGHDYNSLDANDVSNAVNEIFPKNSIKVFEDSSWLVKL